MGRALRLRRAHHRQTQRPPRRGRTGQPKKALSKGHPREARPRPRQRLFHLIGNSIFLRLSDVASGLPPYTEEVLVSGMDAEPDSTGLSQRSAYEALFETLRATLADALARGSTAPARRVSADPARLPGRVHQGRDRAGSRDRRGARAGAAAVGGQAIPQGESARRPGGRRAAGGTQGAGLRHPHRERGTSPGAWTTSSPGTGSASRS